MKPRYTVGLAIAGAALFAVAWSSPGTLLGQIRETVWTPKPTADAPSSATAQAADLRVLLVADHDQRALSPADLTTLCRGTLGCNADERDGLDAATLLAGAPPQQPTRATVLTDTNCAPDGRGISHCLNTLRLADGAVITVRHNHNMQIVPCLTPGETVEVVGTTVG